MYQGYAATHANAMFADAGILPTDVEFQALCNDLQGIVDEEYGDDSDWEYAFPAAVAVLTRRIGGLKALKGYVTVLVAGEQRRLARQR